MAGRKVKADLITGFLGAGKTTFIRKYADYLVSGGEKVCILENDHGAVNVDAMLLSDLKSDSLGIEMVAGGCDQDCHIRRFRTKLITIAMLGYDRVIIEPSGIYDVDEFFDVIHEEPLEDRYEISSVIAIVDADLSDIVSKGGEYLLASQVAQAGVIIFSKTGLYDNSVINKSVERINTALESIKCSRRFTPGEDLLIKDWSLLNTGDMAKIANASFRETSFEKDFSMDSSGFDSLFFMNVSLKRDRLLENIKAMFEDEALGHVIRVKGFIRTEDGGWEEINATPNEIRSEPVSAGQDIIIVIGEGIDTKKAENYLPSRYSTDHVR